MKPLKHAENSPLPPLAAYDIFDTPPEAAFDDLARRAAGAFDTTMAGISFFARDTHQTADRGRVTTEWFKARLGLPFDRLAPSEQFYPEPVDAALPSPVSAAWVIADTLADKRYRDHPFVKGLPRICFFAACPILSPEGCVLGLLSVFDNVSREASSAELASLTTLAAEVSGRMEARREARARRLTASADALLDDARKLEHFLTDEIIARKTAEATARYEKDFANAAMQSLRRSFFMLDESGKLMRWNDSFATSTGHTAGDLARMGALEFIAKDARAPFAGLIRRANDSGELIVFETHLHTRGGRDIPYSVRVRMVVLDGRRFCIGLGHDISEQKYAEREIIRAKERLDLALVGSGLAIWDWDITSDKLVFSENWEDMLGVVTVNPVRGVYGSKEVLGWIHAEDRERFSTASTATIAGNHEYFHCEYRAPGPGNTWVWLHSKGKVTERHAAGHALRLTGTTANISKRRVAEERAEFLATRDPLTGLPNRMLANDRLEQGVANAARKHASLAFMFIDLDRFKTINDSLGHDVGDELLKRVAARLLACVRASDTVARLGGDEFAVILENLPANENIHEGARQVAEKMIAALAAPIMINSHHLTTSCSIGIGLFPSDGTDPKTLMKHADVAMYDAKAKGRNNFQFFSHELNLRAQERLSIENYLRLAQRREELLLHYQPRVSFESGKVTGVEALLRWRHPRHGLLAPDKFLSVAEDSGLIVPIGEWVIEHAFRQVAAWQQKTGRDIRLAVNFSAAQLVDGERLVRMLSQAASASRLPLHTVELELTESILLKNIDDKAPLLKQLGGMGLGLAIDDFGTGYSSLAYLRQLPVDSIKVDSSFVRRLGTDPNDMAIVQAMIAMTHSLGLNVVAEGVETEEQYRALRDLKCDEYQGFFFAKPLPAEEFEAEFLDID